MRHFALNLLTSSKNIFRGEPMSEVKLAEKLGIKETKEAVDGVMQMAMVLVLVLKDGAQLGDIASVIEKISTDEIMRQKMQAAMDGITKVPAEDRKSTRLNSSH